MKVSFNETHDRLQHFTKQSFNIAECCQNIINQRPFGNIPFYIFAHARTDDDGVNKRLIWQPRLSKPKAQTNSMLFKAYPGTDIIRVLWMIPDRSMWSQFQKGLMMENKTICESIHSFLHDRVKLEAPDPEDLTDEQMASVYSDISNQAKYDAMMKKQFPDANS
jgi:hypothetical protein